MVQPIPVIGPTVLAFLDSFDGVCSCSPEAGSLLVVLSAYTESAWRKQEMCVVRAEITRDVFADVNQDGFINEADLAEITNSSLYQNRRLTCYNDPSICGRLDANRGWKRQHFAF